MSKKLLERNLTLLPIKTVLNSLIFAAPILVLLMQSRGLTFAQIMFLQSLFAISGMLFEVPSGYFSDKLGRKITIIIGTIFLAIGSILFSIAYSVWTFISMEMAFAFGYAMLSGTVSSLLYETLLELDRQKEYTKYYGNLNFYSLMSVAFASVVGGFIAKYSLDLTVYIINIPFILAIIVTLFLTEPTVHKNREKQSIREDFKEVGGFLKKNLNITYIIIFSAVVFLFNQSVFWLYQPYFKEVNIPIIYYGVLFATFQVVAALASKYAHKIEDKVGIKKILVVIAFASPISIILMGLNMHMWGVLFIYAQQVTRSFKMVVVSRILHDSVESHFRATLESISSFLAKIGFAAILPLIGYYLDYNSLSSTLILLGSLGVVVIGMVVYVTLKKS
jgi:MFS family permease